MGGGSNYVWDEYLGIPSTSLAKSIMKILSLIEFRLIWNILVYLLVAFIKTLIKADKRC